MKTVDRDLLEVAIRSIDDSCNHSDETSFADLKRMVIEAARAHLATLPKPKVEFRVWWECQGSDYSAPCASRPEAEKFHDYIRSKIDSARFVHITGPHTVSA